jgi:hypothetical protein
MNLELINSIACGLVALWATWCVLSGKVRDGIVGKLIYSAIAISGFVVMTRNQTLFFGPTNAGPTRIPLPGWSTPHVHGHVLGCGEEVDLLEAELRALPAGSALWCTAWAGRSPPPAALIRATNSDASVSWREIIWSTPCPENLKKFCRHQPKKRQQPSV